MNSGRRQLRCTITALMLIIHAATISLAQDSGPIQPGLAGSGGSGVSVDEFTGAFSFGIPLLHIPGPHGSGYTVNLSYQSGSSFNEATWVGYGWNLGPGAIIRDKRGIPDDYTDTITYWNKRKPLYTVTATTRHGLEILSKDYPQVKDLLGDFLGAGVTFSTYLKYNSRMGYSRTSGLDVAVKGIGGVGHTVKDDETSYQPYLAPTILLNLSMLNLNESNSMDPATPSKAANSMFRRSLSGIFSGVNNVLRSIFSDESDRSPRAMTGFTGYSENYSEDATISIPPFLMGIGFGEEGTLAVHNSIPRTPLKSYGYMYSHKALSDEKSVMDYSVERDIPYNKKDVYLPIPLTNADNYYAGGSAFRIFHRNSGFFRPNSVTSSLSIRQSGSEWHGGFRFGMGIDLGIGQHSHSITSWRDSSSATQFDFSGAGDEPYFFRMRGDLGGSITVSDTHGISIPSMISDSLGLHPVRPANIFASINDGERSGRCAYVGCHTNKEMNGIVSGTYYQSFNKDTLSRRLAVRDTTRMKDGVGEFSIVGGDGSRYVYGIPVYSRNEKSLALGLEGLAISNPQAIKNNGIAYKNIVEGTAPVVMGEEMHAPYATAYLLTEINSPDYVDMTADGPTQDDLGGYTLFRYRRAAGSDDKFDTGSAGGWYRWRTPYTGLKFEKGSLVDPEDDLGSVATGEREMYYLESIETKTHRAVFITNRTDTSFGGRVYVGSQTDRRDGFQQRTYVSDSVEALIAGDSTTSGTAGTNLQEKLERIELYVKGWSGTEDKLLQTVYLEYDYSLRKGLPNSLSSSDGLLTLRKVWSQNQDVVNSKIHPYFFGYEYRTSEDYETLPADVRDKYSSVIEYGDRFSSEAQNPDYTPFDADRWGSYQYDGAARSERFNPWVKQVPDSAFDPAAWQLKWIRMPGGGELHVQYEQKDYAYVQDRPAMAMVSLLQSLPGTSKHSYDSSTDNFYYLNLGDLGIDSSSYMEVAKVRSMINQELKEKGRKMYFRFLYALKGEEAHIDSSEYTSDYITGFATIDTVLVDTAGSGGGAWYAVKVRLKGTHDYAMTTGETLNAWVPKTICWDFVKKNRRGMLAADAGVPFRNDVSAMVSDLLGRKAGADINLWNHCKAVDFANSYVRIPMTTSKLGGGIRVKRILDFDPGIGDSAMLRGAEYIYEVYDEERHQYISSGVASNEPGLGREENALVDFAAPERAEDFREKFVAGKDIGKYIGPIGEGLLPGAAVGYSRIVARSIHDGRTSPGFSVSEYFTAKDYPFDGVYQGLGRGVESRAGGKVAENPAFLIPLPWFKINKDHLWLTHGYRFIQHGMHGALKRSARYGGLYDNPDSWALAASREVQYFQPGEKIPVVGEPGDTIRLENPGMEMEVITEGISITDDTWDISAEGDLSIPLPLPVPPTPAPSGNGQLSLNFNSLQTAVTTKIIRYPTVVKSTLSYGDGIYHFAENVAFDSETGSPVITRTSDGFNGLELYGSAAHNGLYHQFGIPAHTQYPSLGQKAFNERAVLKNSTGSLQITRSGAGASMTLTFTPSNHPGQDLLTVGDLIKMTHSNGSLSGLAWVEGKSSGTIHLRPAYASGGTGSDVDVEVLSSGRSNQLGASVGGFATYGEDINAIVTGENILEIDSVTHRSSHAIAASAMTLEKSLLRYPSGDTVYNAPLRPASGYVYRTAISGGGRYAIDERTYTGGIMDTLALFSWAPTGSNDSTKWLRTSTTTLYNADGVPLENRDALGLYSTIKLGYDSTVPVLQAVNARYDQVSFTSFEDDGNDLTTAHAGLRSWCFPGDAKSVEGVSGDTVLLRFWVKYSDYAIWEDPSANLVVRINSVNVPVSRSHQIAHVGEWTLYEIRRETGASTIEFYSSGLSGDSIWIDDVRVQPVDAEMICHVYDRHLLRPMTTFDTDHFGAYTQYNAEGRAVRTIVETTRGRKTVQEVHANVPGLARTVSAESLEMPGMQGRGGNGLYQYRNGIDDMKLAPGLNDGKMDLFDFELGADGARTKVLGGDIPKLPELNKAPDLGMPGELKRLEILGRLHELDEREGELRVAREHNLSEKEIQIIESELSTIRNSRRMLLESIGMTEEQFRALSQGDSEVKSQK